MNEEKNRIEEKAASCCGGPAPEDGDACCVQDAEAKAAGERGCGCATASAPAAVQNCCAV